MSKWYERMTSLREEKGTKQQEIADVLGIDYTSYNRYENGKTTNISRSFEKKLLKYFTSNEVEYIKNGGEKPQKETKVINQSFTLSTNNKDKEIENRLMPQSLAPDILNIVDMLKDIDKIERRKVLRFVLDLQD